MKELLEPYASWLYNLTSDDYYNGSDRQFTEVIEFTFICLAVIACLIWLIYVVVYEIIDKRQGATKCLTGTLIDKRYRGEETHHSTGTALVSNGQGGLNMGIVSSTSTSEEEFLFFVHANSDNTVYKLKVGMQEFYAYPINSHVTFTVKTGKLSNRILQSHLLV